MSDLLIRNVKPETLAWLKGEAHRHGRSISDEAKVILIRRLWRDGDLSTEVAEADLLALNAALLGDD
jgi:plasmid stability protein